MHLKPDELVDLAEGARAESSAPHLAACAECRRQLAEMRATMSEAAAVDVPEPSPIFWTHLSGRVSDAVASEPRRRAWLDVAAWRQVLMPGWAVAIASVVVVVALSSRLMAPPPMPPPPNSSIVTLTPFSAAPPPPSAVDTSSRTDVIGDAADDASLMLVASLTSAMDLDAASDAGLAPSGAAEHALTHMRDTELRELERLLKEEMVGS